MSQENVDLYHRFCEALDAREVPADGLASGFRIDTVVTAVTEKTYHGAAGVREWLQDYFEAFGAGARFEVEKIIVHDDDFVVARVHLAGTGARSGAPLELRWMNVMWFSDGKVTRAAGYASREEALEAVGLSEQDAHADS